ncbi:MAG TPA: tetratricopeptide repeat protein [Bryobacteraceae bacterium]|nr:tetratricopeptide repeat protein [Bryobacteraceae bacterium]
MSTDRIEALNAMLAQDPGNSFVRYGLAQSYTAAGRLEEAVASYRALLEKNPDYVAAYFHAGQTLEKLGRTGDAKAIYEEGLTACARTGDTHTQSEIQQALDIL